MNFMGQRVLPAVRKMRDLELLIKSPFQYLVLLDSHVSQLQSVSQLARSNGKKLLIHADLIHGLKNDEYAIEFLCQTLKPAGIISTKSSAVVTAKKHKVLAIQRHFLLDTTALETIYKITEKNQPDFIEVLPGVMPHIIAEMHAKLSIPILAGGLIRTVEEVELALQAGAVAVTTSHKEIWSHY
ncbi:MULTISPECIES: glycerol-3-phosphate responsive antiterminator [Paenibacillus]|jgi:glycerol uptake operon antiterminator|uniref:Glycerol uptake operon antiterminator regulatory protein n=1 Tax=Paenibacillus baimaensis TaxID=2982185 RepID=A0ABT2UPX2_9BACL|nr:MULTISPECIES: glycerol-3-phosphate responsive antiterminator [unclassified Paenibacillus]MCU6796690.1 glycerol-3-phosphate responsive antiterminator [Paenibacillus sp. WQ 127069]OMF14867.1 glycerol-3-phosphate responsive antiterminator GlpP [Paenibacillus sp. FSL H7-0331]